MSKYIPIFAMLFVVCACHHSQSLTFHEAKCSRAFKAVVERTAVQAGRCWGRSGGLAVGIRLRREDGALIAISTDQATLTELALVLDLTNGAAYLWPKAVVDFEAAAQERRQQKLHSPRDSEPMVPTGN